MLRKVVCFSLFSLLISCTSTNENINQISLENNQQEIATLLPDEVVLKSWAYQINLFYMSDAETVILPYINLVRSFDNAKDNEYCSKESNDKIATALKLNPSSLVSYLQLYVCSTQSGEEIEAKKHLDNVQNIAEALLKESSGESIAEAIEVRELDEAHIILEFSGLRSLDLEIIQYADDFVYKFHVYDAEINKFEYRYFKNSKLLKVMYSGVGSKMLTTKQVTNLTLSTYIEQKFSAALIPVARHLLLQNKFQQVIELISPVSKDSGVAMTLLAEAYLKSGKTDELYGLIDALEIFSNSGLLDTKVLLAQFIQTYAESEDEFDEVKLILEDIDNLTSPGTGALLLAKKLSTYDNSVDLISTWLEESNNLAYWDVLPLVAKYIHQVNPNKHTAEYELLLLSAEKSNSQSLFELAKMHKNGHVVNKNNTKAIELYQTSAKLGNASAQLDLGYYFENGALGLNKNNDIAFEWYSKSAKQFNAIALSNLANFYEHGKAVKQDLTMAAKYYNESAAAGYHKALCNLGDLYLDYKDNIEIDKALSIYKAGADKGLSDCQFSLGYTYGEFLNDQQEALTWYKKAANQNNATAITNIGYMYQNGVGVEVDLVKGFEYYLKAADLGNAAAQENLGRSYEFGIGTKQDYAKAHEYFAKGAAQNHAGAIVNLGTFYNKGVIVKKNRAKALELYKKSADLGNSAGAFNLGNAYLYGDGVEKDLEKSLQYYKQSSMAGYVEANCKIGKIYRDLNEIDVAINYLSLGVEKGISNCMWQLGFTYGEALNDYEEAIKWYELAGEKGDRDAFHSLGVIYDFGNGVEQNYAKAFEYYQLAADLGEPTSQANLGFMYEAGKSIPVDNKMAFEYYKKAAEQNDDQGLNNLATFYFNGIVVVQDQIKAISLYKKAAELGNDFALNNLGKAYRDGAGVDVDYKIALDYFEKAVLLDFSDAIESAGVMYHLGLGTEVDNLKAIEYLTQSSDLGYEIASYYLGNIYLTSDASIKDVNQALKYLTISTEQGDIDAPYDLGEIYRKGEHVSVDISKAIFWHSKSASHNNSKSLPILASIYWTATDGNKKPSKAIELLTEYANIKKMNPNFYIGLFFNVGEYVKEDYSIAREFYKKGVREDDSGSINNLAELYRLGLGGDTDYGTAIQLYKQAERLGSLHALFNLGEMHRDGHGVDVNIKEALNWFLLAANKGFLDAMYQVALIYQKGIDLEVNLTEANFWLEKASEKGFLAAQLDLGKNLIAGNGIKKDESYGIELIEKSAKKGFKPAIQYLSLQK